MPKLVLSVLLALQLGGCANITYYAQAVGGHVELMNSAQPISQLIHDPGTDPGLREKLEKVTDIREFASQELALPDNGSYRSYADLGRPYVVWNVFAAQEFSVNLEAWCLLFVGCVNYRGYYNREAAEHFASQLKEKGLETYVASIPAYSTLGFFDDPVLNTFLRFGEQEVARTLFHELAHQVVFIPGDSAFNESFATAVENEGMRRWLTQGGDPERLQIFQDRQAQKTRFQALVADYREKLREVYGKPWSAEDKRRAKQDILAKLRRTYATSRTDRDGRNGYEAFFETDLNNAKLGSVSLYTTLVPAFEALLDQVGHDLPSFYRRVEALSHMNEQERQSALNTLLELARLKQWRPYNTQRPELSPNLSPKLQSTPTITSRCVKNTNVFVA